MDLTLHCCARGLREEWNKQEVDEVDEGQGIVPEQASCRDKNTNTDLTANPPFDHNKNNNKTPCKIPLIQTASLLLCARYVTLKRRSRQWQQAARSGAVADINTDLRETCGETH